MAAMNIFQRILSHSVSIILVIVIVLVYVYRDNLFPSDEEAATETTQVSESATGTAVDGDAGAQADTDAAAASADSDAGAQADNAAAAPADSDAAVASADTEAAAAVAPAQPPAYQQRPAMPMQPPMPGYRDPRMQPPAGYGRPPQTAMQTPAPADTTTGTATEQPPVMQARQAYWNRQFDKAEEQYQALAKSEPENPDPHGELGNLYYSQGRWQDAADSYYEAATRLLDKGHTSRAMYLQQIIAGLDRVKADKLAKQIAEARQPAPVNQ